MLRLAFLLSILMTHPVAASENLNYEVFLHGEKPLKSIQAKTPPLSPIEIGMAKNAFETVLIRPALSQSSGNILIPYDTQLQIDNAPSSLTSFGNLELRTYWVASVNLKRSSFGGAPSGETLDIAVPLSLASDRKFKVQPENIPQKPAYLFELFAGPSTPAGVLIGNIKFKIGKAEYKVPIRLKIYSTKLPDEFKMKTSLGWDPTLVMNKHYGKWDDHTRELNRKYFELATEHRVDLHKIYMKFPDPLPKKSDPKLAQYDPLQSSPPTEDSFMSQWEPLVSGKSSQLDFNWSITDLPVPEMYKENVKSPSIDAQSREFFWKKMNESVLRHHLEDHSFVYFADEPSHSELVKIGESLRKIRKWAPQLHFLVTRSFSPALEGGVNLWCPNLSEWDMPGFPSPGFYQKRREVNSEEFWFYTSCTAHGCESAEDISVPDLVTDRPAAYARVFPWIGFRYHAGGILYYNTVQEFDPKNARAPWDETFPFHGNGEGNLFYPCNQFFCGVDEQMPLASLRLKALRDGLQDAEILEMGRKAHLPVDDWVHELIPNVNHFPHETAPYDRLKLKVLEALGH